MIRARFAPSPTGYLHLGNIRTALFNYFFAKASGGKFILRIEDTDQERSKKEYLEAQKEDLLWMGIRWDEGPDVGGPHGPYLQSERMGHYSEALQRLLDEQKAYACYVTEEEVAEMKRLARLERRPPHFDNRGRYFSKEEIEKRKAKGIKPTIRFRIDHPLLQFEDVIRGKVSFNLDDMVGDFVIQRADGMPTFHLAVVVDDAMMQMTHVIRGEDHLSNTPKHILLQQALGFKTPIYAHLSLVHGPGGEPLSKRLSAVSVKEFRKQGYLPHALANYIALLGWAPPDNKEVLSWKEILGSFDLTALSKSASCFDPDKLNWMNGEHLRLLSDEEFSRAAMAYLKSQNLLVGNEDQIHHILPIFKDNVHRFEELSSRLGILKNDFPYEDPNLLKNPQAKQLIEESLKIFSALKDGADFYQQYVSQIKSRAPLKGKDLFHSIRMIVSGKINGPELKRIFPALGLETIKQRFEKAKAV